MTDLQTAAVVAVAAIPLAYLVDNIAAVVRHRLRTRKRHP